jgi:hypothetical protein
LADNSIKKDGAWYVSETIAKLGKLTSLNLNLNNSEINSESLLQRILNLIFGNDINKGVRLVSEAISKLHNLKSLDLKLELNKFNDEGARFVS